MPRYHLIRRHRHGPGLYDTRHGPFEADTWLEINDAAEGDHNSRRRGYGDLHVATFPEVEGRIMTATEIIDRATAAGEPTPWRFSEDDGQPDEAQEWADFDPYC